VRQNKKGEHKREKERSTSEHFGGSTHLIHTLFSTATVFRCRQISDEGIVKVGEGEQAGISTGAGVFRYSGTILVLVGVMLLF